MIYDKRQNADRRFVSSKKKKGEYISVKKKIRTRIREKENDVCKN